MGASASKWQNAGSTGPLASPMQLSATEELIPTRRRTWDAEELLGARGERIRRPSDEVLARLRDELLHDAVTEFDGRLLTEHVESLPYELSPAARAAFEIWDGDERRHHLGFRLTLDALYDDVEPEIERFAERRADFGPLKEFFGEEFTLLLLGAYDELCTVRGYRKNLPLYDELGPEFGRYVRHVIADEAWHYSLFLGVLRREHSHRRDETAAWLERIRAAEATPYAATFVLDHDDKELYSDEIGAAAERILMRQFGHARG